MARLGWLPGVAVAVLAFVAFIPALSNGFVDWDDPGVLTDNPHWRGLGREQLAWMFTTNHYGHYQPITWLTYGLDYELWGMNPRGYHLTNNLLHAFNAMLVYLVALRLLRGAVGARVGERGVTIAAAVTALLFALHPLRVESVAWATERRDLVSAFFLLLTLLAYLRFATPSDPQANPGAAGSGRWWWYAAALGLYVVSMLSKVGGAPLPVVLLVLDWYPLRRLGLRPRDWGDRGALRIAAEKGPFLLVAIGFSVATVAQQTGRWLIPVADHGLVARAAQSCYGLVFYAFKTIAPFGLLPLYELRVPLNPFAPVFIASFVAVVAITALAVWAWHRGHPALAAAWVCYGAMLGPLLGFFQNGPQIVADRYSYLSTLGWLLLVGAGVALLAHRSRGAPRAARVALAGGVAVVIATLGVMTWRQTLVWRDTTSLWTWTWHHDPDSSFACNGYGYVLLGSGRAAEAVELFQRAVAIRPDNQEAHENLWDALGRLNRAADRERALQAATAAAQPSIRARAHYLLGTGRLAARRDAEAAEHLAASLSLVETYAPAHVNLAIALMRLNRAGEAIDHYRRAIGLDPAMANAHDGLAWALSTQGRRAEAIAVLEGLLATQPDYEPARRRLERLRSGP